MRTTIDQVGRLVIPKSLRDQVGLGPGEVDVTVDGVGLKIEPIMTNDLEHRAGRLVIPAYGQPMSRADNDRLRRTDQR